MHHDWFSALDEQFATTPITQGTLLTLAVRAGIDARTALDLLTRVTEHDGHVFWPD